MILVNSGEKIPSEVYENVLMGADIKSQLLDLYLIECSLDIDYQGFIAFQK